MKQPELGKRIAELRQSQGLTQEELVEKCNINVRTIQRIEAGEVTPRNYTVKAIFEVLGSTWDELVETSTVKVPGLDRKWMVISFVSAIIYLFTGIPEAVMDYSRMSGDIFNADFLDIRFSGEGSTFYVLIKLVSSLSFVAFMSGFFHVAGRLKLLLLKAGAVSLILLTLLFASFDIMSLWLDSWDFSSPVVMVVYLMSMGVGAVLFGLGLLSLRSSQGDLALVAGLMELVMALSLFTFVFSFLAIFLAFPTLILEAILLYKMFAKSDQS